MTHSTMFPLDFFDDLCQLSELVQAPRNLILNLQQTMIWRFVIHGGMKGLACPASLSIMV